MTAIGRIYNLATKCLTEMRAKFGMGYVLAILLMGGCLVQAPANAGSWTDIETLKTELKKTGTKVLELKCKEKELMSYYEFEDKKLDQIVICVNNIDKDDPDEYWESLVHEATHVMHACTGDYALNDKSIARAYRELQAINPTSVEDIQAYGSWNKRQEVEARWMEFQAPEFAIELLKLNCKEVTP